MHQNIQRIMQLRNKTMEGNSRTWARAVADAALSPVGTGIAGGAGMGLLDGGYSGMSVGALLGMMGRSGQRRLSQGLRDRLAPHMSRQLTELSPEAMDELVSILASDQTTRGAMSILTHPMRIAAGRSALQPEE